MMFPANLWKCIQFLLIPGPLPDLVLSDHGPGLDDFIIGTFALALLAVIIGEFTISLAYLAARKRIERVTDETIRYQNLSMEALTAGDKGAYQAANKLANDAFGHSFFMQIALSAAFLWPICFALAWMSYRFEELEFPAALLHFSLGYIAVFLLLFVAAYFVFKPVKYRIPYFRRIKEMLKTSSLTARNLKSFGDLLPRLGPANPPGPAGKASPSP